MLLLLIIFVAIFTQAVSGFGLALVSMPLLVAMLGIQMATPLVALVAFTAELLMLLRYRHAFNLRAVARLSVASVVGIPLGVYLLRRANPDAITALLGVIIIAYALYALFSPRLPELNHPAWAYGLGFVAGLLSGAYNTSGPPVVIYGTCRRWPPAGFKSNLQGFFLLNSCVTIAVHSLSGSMTRPVLQSYLQSLPAIALGLLAGFALDNRINQHTFRRIVLILLLLLGARLLWPI